MLIKSASLAINQLFSKPFRKIFWQLVGYTILLLVIAWFALETLFSAVLVPWLGQYSWGAWVATAAIWFTGFGMLIGAGFLIAPLSAIFAGLFLDDVAREVEATHYPADPPGHEMKLAKSIWLAIKFTILVVMANLLALMLVLLPGINFIVFFFLNGYLLGREYFQFAAMRFLGEDEARKLRQANEGNIFLGGILIAGFMSIPLLNLITPLFAAAMMVHVYKHTSNRQFKNEVSP